MTNIFESYHLAIEAAIFFLYSKGRIRIFIFQKGFLMKKVFGAFIIFSLLTITNAFANETTLNNLSNISVAQHCIDRACVIQDKTNPLGTGDLFFTTKNQLKTLMKYQSFWRYHYKIVSEDEFIDLQNYVQYTFQYIASYDKPASDPVRCAEIVAGAAIAGAGAGALGGAELGATLGASPTGVAVGAVIGAIGGAIGGAVGAHGAADSCHSSRGIVHGSGHTH
ncbi:MAG: hypothetical protein HQK52_12840 [Oligoflexia bacterium]|nr:hypothetical protein [Oligoflexia bacterium]